MNQNIDFLISQKIKNLPSNEEIELFNAYKQHIDRDFELFKQANLALTMQENELNDAKELLVKKVEEFNCRKQNANDVLNIINKEIDVAIATLNDLKRECNQHRCQLDF